MRQEPSIFSYTTKNYKALKHLKVKKPYVWYGHIEKNLKVTYDSTLFDKFKKLGFQPIPMIESHYNDELDFKGDQESITSVISGLSKSTKELMIDIEPQLDVYLPFYKTIRKNYPYHISSCFDIEVNKKVVKYVDRVTPMMYEYATSMYKFEERVRKTIEGVLKLKKEFSLGIPITTTFHEFEIIKNERGKIISKNNHKIMDYAKKVFEVVDEYNAFENKYFKGIVWWGHIDGPLDKYGLKCYPYSITSKRAKEANFLLRKYLK